MQSMSATLLDRMLSRVGKAREDLPELISKGEADEVMDTPDLRRIVGLPRRGEVEADHVQWSKLLRSKRAPSNPQMLRPLQAQALQEIYEKGGLLGAIRVGGGKTLITKLAPVVLKAKKPVLLIPAALRSKTIREFAKLDLHWKRHGNLKLVTYEFLSRPKNANYLTQYAPDCLICDEVHKLKNPDAAVTRMVSRYMRENPLTAFVGLSGTITKRSITDFAHLLAWALKPGYTPLPVKKEELNTWARCVDVKVEGKRPKPGALAKLGPVSNVNESRATVAKRIRDTQGVIVAQGEDVDASIIIRSWRPVVPPEITEALDQLRNEGVVPWGDTIADRMEVYRHARSLVCGFAYRWDPPAPPEWLKARRAWRGFVRDVLAENIDGLDSEMRIAKAVMDRKLPDGGRLRRWAEIRKSFEVNSVPVWISDLVLRQAIIRIQKAKVPTIVWVEHIAVGEKLRELTAWPFFHRQGRDHRGRAIEDARGETVIASIGSNIEGRNLQAWAHNSVISPLSNGLQWEQLIGRTHRFGQEADEVRFDVMIGDELVLDGFRQAFADARYQATLTSQSQKLLLADTDLTI